MPEENQGVVKGEAGKRLDATKAQSKYTKQESSACASSFDSWFGYDYHPHFRGKPRVR